MPWKASDSKRHSKIASTPRRSRMWADVANRVLKATGNEVRAVRSANAVVKRDVARSAKRTSKR